VNSPFYEKKKKKKRIGEKEWDFWSFLSCWFTSLPLSLARWEEIGDSSAGKQNHIDHILFFTIAISQQNS